MYEKVILKTLKKHRGAKRKYNIIEDNDPSGYKSNIAMDAEKPIFLSKALAEKQNSDKPRIVIINFFILNLISIY